MRDRTIKAVLVIYLIIAFLVGAAKARENNDQMGSGVMLVFDGLAWPVTLLIDAVQRQ